MTCNSCHNPPTDEFDQYHMEETGICQDCGSAPKRVIGKRAGKNKNI